MQIELFQENDLRILRNKINSLIHFTDNPVVLKDVKFFTEGEGFSKIYIAFVIYE